MAGSKPISVSSSSSTPQRKMREDYACRAGVIHLLETISVENFEKHRYEIEGLLFSLTSDYDSNFIEKSYEALEELEKAVEPLRP